MKLGLVAASLLFATTFGSAQDKSPGPEEVTIRRQAGDSEIVITTTSRLAGAIHSVTWRGKEFIDSADHGRQLQSAINLDDGAGRMVPETFNPTEAGSRRDGAGPNSTSRLLHRVVDGERLQTTTQMAFWLAPGERSSGNLATNSEALSNHLLTKRVKIGYRDLSRVLQYEVTFGLPIDEHHELAQFEVLTGYMPAEFKNFWSYDPESRKLEPLSDGPGEQRWPVVLATADGRYAMGCFTPDRQRGQGWSGPGYGRFRFREEQVVKWNCVFRYRNPAGVEAGDYRFRVFVVIGDLEMVREDLVRLHELHLMSVPQSSP